MPSHQKQNEQEQIGLVLPNGRIVWPPEEYKGYPLDTPQARYILLKVLKKSAEDLDFNEDQFLAQYGWATRFVTIDDGNYYQITDDDFFVVEIGKETDPDVIDEDLYQILQPVESDV